MRIATWNINSVRLRLPRALELLAAEQPDVLCLQEIKALEDQFPAAAFAEAGYPHQAVVGLKGYNGVAVVSRLPIEETARHDFCARGDARHLAVRIAGGPELHNLYIPAGGDIPDPVENPKFAHKLQFLDELTAWFAAGRRAAQPMILVGDLNIAPLETDVWSHKQLLDVVSHTPVEVAALAGLQAGLGWVDAVRHRVPASERLYTWWSYRARDWDISDRGRRLDHVWVTPPLAASIGTVSVLRAARGWEKASDHVPVIVDLDLG